MMARMASPTRRAKPEAHAHFDLPPKSPCSLRCLHPERGLRWPAHPYPPAGFQHNNGAANILFGER